MAVTAAAFEVPRLGEAQIPNPLQVPDASTYVEEDERILLRPHLRAVREDLKSGTEPISLEVAGPRRFLYFDPRSVRAAIATCGGISPGLNVVVRALVVQLAQRYGVPEIFGVRFGYNGLRAPGSLQPLRWEEVESAPERGGTVLGTSRGHPPVPEMVDTLVAHGIQMLFTIGGDGTLRGALEIWEEVTRRELSLAVVGIPKTIDNDIPWVRRSFGFETAVRLASTAIRGAHAEASSVRRGVGIVKLMGRNSGYLAAAATVATGLVDCCLVPEVPFSLEGSKGVFSFLERRLEEQGFAVLVVAEGAGQELFEHQDFGFDASGNRKLGDIGRLLVERIQSYFAGQSQPVSIKYFDPSYLVRSAPADTADSLHGSRLAQAAAHAALSGRTGLVVGYWHGQVTHVPLKALKGQVRRLNPYGELWWNVLETTGQPLDLGRPRSG